MSVARELARGGLCRCHFLHSEALKTCFWTFHLATFLAIIFGNNSTGCWLGYGGGCLMQRQYIVKIIWNVSDWLSYSGGALIKVLDSAGSTVHYKRKVPLNCVCH